MALNDATQIFDLQVVNKFLILNWRKNKRVIPIDPVASLFSKVRSLLGFWWSLMRNFSSSSFQGNLKLSPVTVNFSMNSLDTQKTTYPFSIKQMIDRTIYRTVRILRKRLLNNLTYFKVLELIWNVRESETALNDLIQIANGLLSLASWYALVRNYSSLEKEPIIIFKKHLRRQYDTPTGFLWLTLMQRGSLGYVPRVITSTDVEIEKLGNLALTSLFLAKS